MSEKDEQVNSVWRERLTKVFEETLDELTSKIGSATKFSDIDLKWFGVADLDPLMPEVVSLAIKSKTIGTALIQKKFMIGYARAAEIIDQMEACGFISEFKPEGRDVYITIEEYKKIFENE